MTATTHSLVGASIGKLLPNPYFSIPLAIVSNFLMDLIPHWDTGTGWRNRPKILTFFATGIDVVLGLFLSFLVFGKTTDSLYLISVVFAATLPDWLEAPYLFLGWDFPPFSWFYKFQSKFHNKNGLPWGIITQLIIVVPIVAFAYLA
ncbi:MAG: Uncharacterized protein LiPW16_127 [Microgenomates group bacterium LiPW_16]|nr:MAG: Uncharacterized protein LiPW16_127 [Microgenomates group bacterium LiPW_16]